MDTIQWHLKTTNVNGFPLLNRLPVNTDAEAAVLGTVLVNSLALNSMTGLRSEDFVLKEHRIVWDAICKHRACGLAFDPITIKDFAETNEELAGAGGAAFLQTLMSCATTPINAGEYANLIVDLSVRRKLKVVLEDSNAQLHQMYAGERSVDAINS